MEDILNDLFGGGFSSGFGGRGFVQTIKGNNVKIEVQLTPKEVFEGVKKKLNYRHVDSNLKQATSTAEIHFKRGTKEGMVYRVQGQGDYPNQMPNHHLRRIPGDLLISCKIVSDEYFKVEGHDLYHHITLPFNDFVYGTEVEVLTIDGKKTNLKIPAGTQSGKKFRYRGKGLPYLEEEIGPYGNPEEVEHLGNLYVVPKVYIPKDLSEKQKEILKLAVEEKIFDQPK